MPPRPPLPALPPRSAPLPALSPCSAPPPPRPRTQNVGRRAAISLVVLTTAITLTTIATPAPLAKAAPPAWRWPLDGSPRVLRRFAPPLAPWLAGHRGIDLAASADTPVLAAGSGTVRYAGPVGGRGVVTIDHPGGLRTTYLPISASVKQGEPITMGSRLGVVQAEHGHCQESCLHWGLIQSARYLDPLLLLGHAPIRLLPIWPKTAPPRTTPPLLPPAPKTPSEAPFIYPSKPSEAPDAVPVEPSDAPLAVPLEHSEAPLDVSSNPSEAFAGSTSTPPALPLLTKVSAAFHRPNPPLLPHLNPPAPLTRSLLPNAPVPPPPPLFVPLPPSLLTVLAHHDSSANQHNALPAPYSTVPQALGLTAEPTPETPLITPAVTSSRPEMRSSDLPLRNQSARTPEQWHDSTHAPSRSLATVLRLLTHAASLPAAPAIGLGTLLGAALLITALRRRRRPHKKHHGSRSGQHRKPPIEGLHRRPTPPSRRSS
ncbi:M23 family metallopeptidase [Nonomuraea sp. NPDC049655]|uniref:M23 family metallopeptidase n=1 Tax=Nonomuraea sp. NPDC049655 TaxID=3364355 RepID=UPI0037AEC932